MTSATMDPASAIPQLTCLGRELDMGSGAFGRMRESTNLIGDWPAIRTRLGEDGFVLLRGYLGRDRVLEARREMLTRLAKQGQLDPAAPLMDGVLSQGWGNSFRTDLAKENMPLMNVLYEGPMIAFFEGVFGEFVRHYDYTWVRSVGRGHGTPPHSDIVYMGRGTWNLYTAWSPMGDVTWDLGGLMVIPGTHKHERLRNVYGRRDVDTYCVSKPGTSWNAPGYDGWLTKDAVGVRRGLKSPWCSSEYRAGDVVVFSTCLVHAGLDNHTDQIRLSTDSRYQPASEPADERWIGTNPVGHGASAKRALIC